MYRIALILCALLCLCVQCGDTADDELVIISPHSPEIRREFTVGFRQWYRERTGRTVKLTWLDVGGTGQAIEYIRSRNAEKKQAGGVDVFFGGGAYPFVKLGSMDLLMPHRVPADILHAIPRELNGVRVYQPDGSWYGAAHSGFGIIYNKEILQRNDLPMPRRWEDLALPQCFGWVASGDPRYSGSIHMMYEVLLQAYGWERGWEIITLMGANVQTFEKGGSSAAKSVATGQAAMGLAIDFYAFIEIERYGEQRLGFALPRGETVITPDGIGILRNAPNAKLARLFVDYVLSQGQKLWILKKGAQGGPVHNALCRLPVDSSLYALPDSTLSVTQNPYRLGSTLLIDALKSGRRWAILGDLIAAFVITPHEELKQCRREIIRRGLAPYQYRRYLEIGLDEGEVFELAKKWTTREFAGERIRLMNHWTHQARKRYLSIFRE